MILFGQILDDVTKLGVIVTILVAAVTSTLTFFAGRWWGRYKASRQWYSKNFLDPRHHQPEHLRRRVPEDPHGDGAIRSRKCS